MAKKNKVDSFRVTHNENGETTLTVDKTSEVEVSDSPAAENSTKENVAAGDTMTINQDGISYADPQGNDVTEQYKHLVNEANGDVEINTPVVNITSEKPLEMPREVKKETIAEYVVKVTADIAPEVEKLMNRDPVVKDLEVAINEAKQNGHNEIHNELNAIMELLFKLKQQVNQIKTVHAHDHAVVKRIKTEVLGIEH